MNHVKNILDNANNILIALAKKCNKKIWDVIWCDESKCFNLIFLDSKDQDICVYQVVHCVEKSGFSGCYWSFSLTNHGKRISSYKAACKIDRVKLAKATLLCIMKTLSYGKSLAYFINDIYTPTIFLKAGTSIEDIIISLELDNLI